MKKNTGKFFTIVGFLLVLLPGGCNMFAIPNGLPHWYGHAVGTHEDLLEAFVGFLEVIVAFTWLSWPLICLGGTLFLIGRRRLKATRQVASATTGGTVLIMTAQTERVLKYLAWLFTAGTICEGCWVVYILIMLGQFPSIYTPSIRWSYPTAKGESVAEIQRSFDETKKICVLKFAPQDAQGSADPVSFRFSGWFIDASAAVRVEDCMSAAGYTSVWPAGF